MVDLTTPASPLKARIDADVPHAFQNQLPGEPKLNITMGQESRGKSITDQRPRINVVGVCSGERSISKSDEIAAAHRPFSSTPISASVSLIDANVYSSSNFPGPGRRRRPIHQADNCRPSDPSGLGLDVDRFPTRGPITQFIIFRPMLTRMIKQFLTR